LAVNDIVLQTEMFDDLMSMTQIPQIGAENPYQKTVTVNWHKNFVPNCMSDASETRTGFLVPAVGADFW